MKSQKKRQEEKKAREKLDRQIPQLFWTLILITGILAIFIAEPSISNGTNPRNIWLIIPGVPAIFIGLHKLLNKGGK